MSLTQTDHLRRLHHFHHSTSSSQELCNSHCDSVLRRWLRFNHSKHRRRHHLRYLDRRRRSYRAHEPLRYLLPCRLNYWACYWRRNLRTPRMALDPIHTIDLVRSILPAILLCPPRDARASAASTTRKAHQSRDGKESVYSARIGRNTAVADPD